MAITPKPQLLLESGEQLHGYSWIAGRPRASGRLELVGSEGARLTILGASRRNTRPQAELTVHGRAAADGAKVSLPTALLTSATMRPSCSAAAPWTRLARRQHE